MIRILAARLGRMSLCLLALSGTAWAQDGLFGNPARFTETSGADIYRAVCAGCHMAQGSGAEGAGAYPSLAANQHLAAPAYPIGVVLHGQRAMPSFARTLSDRQIADVVGYIRQNFGNAYTPPSTEADVRAAR